MPDIDEPLKRELLAENPEFRALYDDHQQAEKRLEELSQQSFLSQEEELAAKQLKRHKLFLKDRMQEIIRSHREARIPARP